MVQVKFEQTVREHWGCFPSDADSKSTFENVFPIVFENSKLGTEKLSCDSD